MTASKANNYRINVEELVNLHSKHTVIKVTRNTNQQYLDCEYTYTKKVGLDIDTHYRAIDTDGKVHFLPSKAQAPDHMKVQRRYVRDAPTAEFVIDLNTEKGKDTLLFFLQHPYCEVRSYENKHTITPIFTVEIRSLEVQGDYKTINDKHEMTSKILALGDEETNRLIYFLGGIGAEKTTVEKKIELIGTALHGLAMIDSDAMSKTNKFLNGENAEHFAIEAAVNEAKEMGLIREDENGYTTDEGTYLGATSKDAVTYYSNKPQAKKKLESQIKDMKDKSGKEEIFSDEEQVKKAIGLSTPTERKGSRGAKALEG